MMPNLPASRSYSPNSLFLPPSLLVSLCLPPSLSHGLSLNSLQSSSLISNATATALLSLGAIDYCLHVLKSLLEFWKTQQGEEEPAAASQLLKPHASSSPPDMSPFFLRQYVKVRESLLPALNSQDFKGWQQQPPVQHSEKIPNLHYMRPEKLII